MCAISVFHSLPACVGYVHSAHIEFELILVSHWTTLDLQWPTVHCSTGSTFLYIQGVIHSRTCTFACCLHLYVVLTGLHTQSVGEWMCRSWIAQLQLPAYWKDEALNLILAAQYTRRVTLFEGSSQSVLLLCNMDSYSNTTLISLV
jgi:hypothetical protein